MKSTRIIVVTGPECSGKTMLSKELATILDCPVVPEYSLEYLDQLQGEYSLKDLEEITAEQKKRIDSAATDKSLVVADTACLVMKVWAEVRFNSVPNVIEQWWQSADDYLFLLCKPDLPWAPGPFRENPDDRHELFEIYRRHLWEEDRNFSIIHGRSRIPRAMDFLKLNGCI